MDLQFQQINNLSKKIRCGCYVADPKLVNQYPTQYIMVPLKTSEYSVEIANSIANISLLQTYYNPTNKYLQLEYNFPINPNACVYRFVATFGNTRMEGIVKEKEQARIEYNQAIKQGKKAAYGQVNAQSKDILTLKVGNVAPKEIVKIEIVYLQELTLACNMFYQLHMMGTISPRYMNYIPGQIVKAGLRNDAAKSQANFYWNFKIQLKTTRKVNFFDSNSHDVELVSQNDARTQSVFAMSKSCVPNKDFIFSYTTEGYELPSYVFGRTDASSTAMISFIPKFCTLNIDDAYKASVFGKGYQTDIQNAKGEYIFLLDRSGSMGGSRMQKAKQALILFIKSLPEDTFFNVISFGSNSNKLFANSKKYSDDQVKSSIQKIKKMSADMGGTQIYQPLFNQITDQPIEGYPKQIFLLTDGGVSNTEGVIRMVGLNNKFSRVHTIGIGNGCSEQLILGCAKKGKGYHVFITDQQDPSQKIIQLLTDSLSPVISKIKLSFDKSVVDSIIPNPQSMPYILKNELVNFYITFKGQLDHLAKFEFSYEDTLNKKPYAAEIAVDPTAGNQSFIDRMAHFKKIKLLEQSQKNGSNIDQNMYYVKVVDKKAEIIKESVRHQILSQFTAFVCTEKELVDGKYQEVHQAGKLKIEIINPPPIEYEQKSLYQPPSSSLKMMAKSSANNISGNAPIVKAAKAQRESLRCMQMKSAKKSSGGFFNSIKSFFGGSKQESSEALKAINLSSTSNQRAQCARLSADIKIQKSIGSLNQKPDLSALDNLMLEIECKKDKVEQNCQLQNLCALQDKEEYEPVQRKKAKRSIKAEQQQIPKLKECQEQKKPSTQPQPSLNISQLISYQTTQGSWKDINLIGRLFGDNVQKTVVNEPDLILVITYLIAKWIEKHHPEKQYSLVVKKGLNFARKNCGNFDKLSQLYDYLIK